MVCWSQVQRSIVMMRMIKDVEDLSQGQKKFILENAPEHGDEKAVVSFCRCFNSTYDFHLSWDKMRHLITKLRRKKRRQGNGEVNGSRFKRGPVRRHPNRRKVAS